MADQGASPPQAPGAEDESQSGGRHLRRSSSGVAAVEEVLHEHAEMYDGLRDGVRSEQEEVFQSMHESVADHLESTYGHVLGDGVAAGAATNVMEEYEREVKEAEEAAERQLQKLRDDAARKLKMLQERVVAASTANR